MLTTYYTSDTHFGHTNIITYCDRPFTSAPHMDAALIAPWRDLLAPGTRLIHAGDFAFKLPDGHFLHTEGLPTVTDNLLVMGNHDRHADGGAPRRMYGHYFGTLVGRARDWRTNHTVIADAAGRRRYRILVSHQPQRDLQGCDLNLYGHVHNNLLRSDERLERYRQEHPEQDDRWLLTSPVHINICVEVQGYCPRTLEELLDTRRTVPEDQG
jgi:calcineurin-like phosphoesterase family protein